MKVRNVILSKGPDDYSCWFQNFKGIYGAGETPKAAVRNLRDGVKLYVKHNGDAPEWLVKCSFNIIRQSHSKST